MWPLSLEPVTSSAAMSRCERFEAAVRAAAPPVICWSAERRESFVFITGILTTDDTDSTDKIREYPCHPMKSAVKTFRSGILTTDDTDSTDKIREYPCHP